MEIDAIFKQRKVKWDFLKKARSIPTNHAVSCKYCQERFSEDEMRKKDWICPACGAYLTVTPWERIRMLADQDSFTELDRKLKTKDPLHFPGYMEKIEEGIERSGNRDAVVTGSCEIGGIKVALGVLDASFLMGSMGTVVGERISRLAEYARKKKVPLIIYSASGGARMQEGLFSLMQMSKTAAAVQRYKDAGGLYISVLTNPTTGGVSASFASLGDIMLAEPNALICFAGPRVIQQTIGQKLPEGFQRAEFLEEHGMIDKIVERKKQKKTLIKILSTEAGPDRKITKPATAMKAPENPTAYDRVLTARGKERPSIMEYIDALFDHFVELKGDRLYREDSSIVGGLAMFHDIPVMVLGHRKGKNTEENIQYNFGMTSPEGYRKACRLMRLAEKLHRPVITFVDTPGAYPGIEAESNGQSNAIAESIALMSTLKVPTIAIITGEGSSGGALALATADSVWMLENAIYAILSPEGFASILWKDAKRAAEACDVMKLTAQELKELGLVDAVVPEGKKLYYALDRMLSQELNKLKKFNPSTLVDERYDKYRKMMGGRH